MLRNMLSSRLNFTTSRLSRLLNVEESNKVVTLSSNRLDDDLLKRPIDGMLVIKFYLCLCAYSSSCFVRIVALYDIQHGRF